MQTKVVYLSDLKFNLETWKRELRFHFNEMDTFQEKLEEIASREFGMKALTPLENFQNRIMIEKDAISKLMHRCKAKMKNIQLADYNEHIDGRLQNEQHSLRDDMRTYIRLHYDLKEEMMLYFLEWL
jgi:benzoyl-CoA reductase/2-hydroxyglutaryl-CoA dehydratase subunit BcrC/BadD/HgdB